MGSTGYCVLVVFVYLAFFYFPPNWIPRSDSSTLFTLLEKVKNPSNLKQHLQTQKISNFNKHQMQHFNFLFFFSSCLMMLENNLWLKRQSPDVNPSWAMLLQRCQLHAENKHARFSEWQPFPHALQADTFPEVQRFDLGFIFFMDGLWNVYENWR